jgi:hypothetical protein
MGLRSNALYIGDQRSEGIIERGSTLEREPKSIQGKEHSRDKAGTMYVEVHTAVW